MRFPSSQWATLQWSPPDTSAEEKEAGECPHLARLDKRVGGVEAWRGADSFLAFSSPAETPEQPLGLSSPAMTLESYPLARFLAMAHLGAARHYSERLSSNPTPPAIPGLPVSCSLPHPVGACDKFWFRNALRRQLDTASNRTSDRFLVLLLE